MTDFIQKGNAADLIIFMGQSNMAGRGDWSQAPSVPKGWGYEFRAISSPGALHHMAEPFGADENNIHGISEPGRKTGSLVSAFAVEYYRGANVPVVGVSASKGGSSINEWQPGGSYLNDSMERFKRAEDFLKGSGFSVRNKFMAWCQGETDAVAGMPGSEYIDKFSYMLEEMHKAGIESCFMVQIGRRRDLPRQFEGIISAQAELCKDNPRAILVSTKFKDMAASGLMKDDLHYMQKGYNIVGAQAGKNAALYATKGLKEDFR